MTIFAVTLKLLAFCNAATLVVASARATDPAPADVAAAIKRSADWHLSNPSGIDTRDWIIAPLYDGLIRTSLVTGDPKHLAEVLRFGNQSGWMAGNRKYHQDHGEGFDGFHVGNTRGCGGIGLLVDTKPDSDGKVTCRSGFAWAAGGEIMSRDQWLSCLVQQKNDA